jgi:hypothetical protein
VRPDDIYIWMRFVPILHTRGGSQPLFCNGGKGALEGRRPLHYIHCYSCLFDGAGKLLRGDRGRERPETAATGVTRRPFIKCYPGCINLILTPFLLTLLPGREICYGWRLKDLSLESGYIVNAAATTAKPVDYMRKPHSF